MYDESGSKTRITTASLTMVTEVMQLAGADHITLSPPLFSELAITPAYSWNKGDIGIKFKESRSGGNVRVQKCEDEAHWRFAFSREQDGEREAKLIRAINVFCNRQADLEFLVRQHIG
jgi:transaldolase